MKILFILLLLVSCGKPTTTITYFDKETIAELEMRLEEESAALNTALNELDYYVLLNQELGEEALTLSELIATLEKRIVELEAQIETLKNKEECGKGKCK